MFKFQCFECSVQYTDRCEDNLNHHEPSHDQEYCDEMGFEEECDFEQCTARFKNKNKLHNSMHAAVRLTPFKHKCPRCPKAFKTPTDLQNHRNSCERVIYSCYKCGERIGSIYAIKHHCKTVQACRPTEQALDRYVALKWKPLQCPDCCKVFANDEQLIEYKITHKPESTFPCGHCSMLCVSQALRSEHISDDRNHFNKNCSDCGRRFSDKINIKCTSFSTQTSQKLKITKESVHIVETSSREKSFAYTRNMFLTTTFTALHQTTYSAFGM